MIRFFPGIRGAGAAVLIAAFWAGMAFGAGEESAIRAAVPNRRGESPIRLVSSDSLSVTLELTVPPFRTEEVRGPDGRIYQRLEVPGWARTMEIGAPELPRLGCLIEAPREGGVELRVLEDSFREVPGFLVFPVPRMCLSEEGDPVEEFVESDGAYNAPGFYPGEAAVIDSRAVIRGVPVARVMFRPFKWNPLSGVLRCSERIRIEVRFDKALPAAASAKAPTAAGAVRAASGGPVHGAGRAGIREPGRGPGNAMSADRLFAGMLERVVVNYAGPMGGGVRHGGDSRGGCGAGVNAGDVNGRPLPMQPRGRHGPPRPPPGGRPGPETGLRMEIVEDGIYRLSFEDLQAAGIDPQGIDPRTFRVESLGEEAAIDVSARVPGVFSPGDHIDFYAEAIDHNLFTETNVYWLFWGGPEGLRMPWTSGKVTGHGTPAGSFRELLHEEEDKTLWEGVPGATSVDYWFWEKMYAPLSEPFTLNVPSPVAAQTDAVLRVAFRGVSTAPPHPDHHARIYLNGVLTGDGFFDGDAAFVQEMALPPGLLVEGDNTVTVDLPNDTGASLDVVYLNWFELEYARRFEPVGGELSFSVEGAGRMQVDAGPFGRPRVRIYDVTDPLRAKKLKDFDLRRPGKGRATPLPQVDPLVRPGGFHAVFETDVNGKKRFHAVTGDRFRKPERMETWVSSDLKNPANGADVLVIAPADFLPSLAGLCQYRTGQGFRTAAVAMEDIYNEFNYGLFHPSALKDFLQYAYDFWTPPAPGYVLFVGDANTDYRDEFGTGKKNAVPVHLFDSSLGVTPNDNWYACVDGGDELPDFFLGRISAGSASMAAGLAAKVLGYEQSTGWVPSGVLLVADDDDPGFEALNEALVPYLPPAFYADKVYLGNYTNVNAATQDIISSIDGGVMIANYVGHGSVTIWAGERMFVSSDVASLSNADYLTFVLTLTCLNGYFSNPFYYSIAEEFLTAEDKGAIGCLSPSGLGYLWEHDILDNAVFTTVFVQGGKNLGAVATQSKISAYGQGASLELVQVFTYLGDPAACLKDW